MDLHCRFSAKFNEAGVTSEHASFSVNDEVWNPAGDAVVAPSRRLRVSVLVSSSVRDAEDRGGGLAAQPPCWPLRFAAEVAGGKEGSLLVW